MNSFIRNNILLILIILLACILRFHLLTTIPVGFTDDEAAFGYNAYSVLKTGHDEWGRHLPFPVFESFGDWKLVFYLYLVTASQFFLGLTVFATRFPSALFGVLAVFATYLLTKEFFKKKVALVASLLLAISPWHIAASRNAFESDLLIFTITLGTYFFIKSLKKKNYLFLGILMYSMSFYIYRSAWVFIPVFMGTLIFLYRKYFRIQKKFLLKNIIIFLFLLLPLVSTFITFKGQSRFFQESFIFGIQNQGINSEINERRGDCNQLFKSFICKTVYNKYSFYFSKYLDNLVSNISPTTYYQSINTTGYQSFSPRGYFYTFEYFLILPGIYFLLKNKQKSTKVLFFWIIIAVLSPSITGVGNPGRLNIIMPIPQIVTALGLVYLSKIFQKKYLKYMFISIIACIVFMSFFRFVIDTLSYYPKYTARYQRYGYKELFQFIESQKSNYSQVIISRRSDDAKQYIHYLFFTKYDPAKYQNNVSTSTDKDGWRSIDQIDNIKFYASTPSLGDIPANSLIVTGDNELASNNLPLIYKIDDPKGDRLFNVYQLNPNIYEK